MRSCAIALNKGGIGEMKFVALFSLSWCLAQLSFGVTPVARSVRDIPGARESLSRMVSPKFYRSLQISPIQGWIVVRGQLAAGRVSGAKVIHTELGGGYDQLALDLA